MSHSRRDFLRTAASTLAGAQLPITSGAHASTDILKQLRRRSDLFCGENNDNLQDLWIEYHERMIALKTKHLGAFDGDISLLTAKEATGFRSAVTALKSAYTHASKKITAEIQAIDAALSKTPEAVTNAIAHTDPLPGIDPATLHDARAIATGKPPPALAKEMQRADETLHGLDEMAKQATRAAQAPQNETWQAKRQDALLRSVQQTLNTLAQMPEIRIESSLTKGYGDDRWSIASRFHAKDIGGKTDKRIQNLFTSIAEDLQKAYPAQGQMLSRGRPAQPGYGEHDCERITFTNPDFRLRRVLEKGYTLHLQQKIGGEPASIAL